MSLPENYGRYQIKRILGKGGMATVYLAHDPRFGRDVALKAIGLGYKDDSTFRTRFEREARTIATLEHPAIVPVYDFGEDNDQLFLVMRYMGNGTLSDRIVMGAMPPDRAIPIVRRIANALDHAHQRGVVHRDLKPGNILFDEYERAYLSDFGIVKLAAEGTSADLTGSGVIGTPSYMSPEQVHGDQIVDGRSDIYTLGVILFEMLTARKPYRADTPVKQMMAHVMEPIPDIRKFLPDFPEESVSVIERALAKAKEDRYQTAHELTSDLTNTLTGKQYEPVLRPLVQIDPVDRDAETMVGDPESLETETAVPLPAVSDDAPTVVKPSETAEVVPPYLPPRSNRRWPYIGVVALLIVGMIGVFALQQRRQRAGNDPAQEVDVSVLPGEERTPETNFSPVDPTDETAAAIPTETATHSAIDNASAAQFQIGTSTDGVPLEAHRFGEGSKIVLLVGGIHAGRAPSSVELMNLLIAQLEADAALLPDALTLLIVPNINPDAIETGLRVNENGVDLNRNWGCNWQPNPVIQGIPVDGLGGDRPFSETETTALRDLIFETTPELVIFWDAPVTTGWVDPAGCTEVSRRAELLGALFVQETGYFQGETPPTQTEGVTGNGANWVDSQGIPALTIWLPSRQTADLQSNLDGLTAIFDALANE